MVSPRKLVHHQLEYKVRNKLSSHRVVNHCHFQECTIMHDLTRKWLNRMLRKLPRNKTQRSLKMVLTCFFFFVFFLQISAACCQLEDVLLQNLKNTWKSPFRMALVDNDGVLQDPWHNCRMIQTYANDRRENKLLSWHVLCSRSHVKRWPFTFIWRLTLGKPHRSECPGRLPQATYSTSSAG